MRIHVAAGVGVARPPEEVFDLVAGGTIFPRIAHALGPIPGIVRVEAVDGRAPEPGARRRVVMTDGSELLEEVLESDRPRRHRYRWLAPPAAPFNLLVRGAEGDWRFTPDGAGTHVGWTYAFELTSPLVYPVAALVLQVFRRWMARALERMPGEVARGTAP